MVFARFDLLCGDVTSRCKDDEDDDGGVVCCGVGGDQGVGSLKVECGGGGRERREW